MFDATVQARLQMNPIHDTRRRLVVMKKSGICLARAARHALMRKGRAWEALPFDADLSALEENERHPHPSPRDDQTV
jgi:hypothetical protein